MLSTPVENNSNGSEGIVGDGGISEIPADALRYWQEEALIEEDQQPRLLSNLLQHSGCQEEDVKKARVIFFEKIVPLVAGVNSWKRAKRSGRNISDEFTAMDEAFALVVLQNSWQSWVDEFCHHPGDATKRRKAKWTTRAGRGKVDGETKSKSWAREGITVYNDIYKDVKEDRKDEKRKQFEKEFAQSWAFQKENGPEEKKCVLVDDTPIVDPAIEEELFNALNMQPV